MERSALIILILCILFFFITLLQGIFRVVSGALNT